MLKKILLGLLVALVAFLAFVATREGRFRYERSGVIAASPEVIYPYLSNFEKGPEWSPYEKADLGMKRTLTGTPGQVGSKLEFASDTAGTGSLEILGIKPNEEVKIRLIMTAPLSADHLVTYSLTPDAGGTRFTWAMEGDGGFMGKLMNVFIDCEAMVAGQFEEGIQNLKSLIEGTKS